MGPNSYTPSQLQQWTQQNAPSARPDNFGNLRQAASRPIVDDFGNRWTGSGRNVRPVMGNPAKLPSPPSPNAATSGIPGATRAAPVVAAGGFLGAATSPAALGLAGIAGALYPTRLGDGTMDSPEAQAQMARNQAANRYEWVNGDVPALAGSTQFQQKLVDAAPKPSPMLPASPQPSPSPQPDTERRRQVERGMTGNAGGLPPMGGAVPPADYSLGTAFAPPQPAIGQTNPLEQFDEISKANAANPPDRTTLIDAWAGGGQPYAPIYAGQSRQIGERVAFNSAPFEPSVGQPKLPPPGIGETRLMGPGGAPGNAIGGASRTPIYETNYTDAAGKTIASVTGSNQRAGNGTLSAPDSGNGGTIEGNVARLNSQIEALRGLREARNPGITTGGGNGGGLPSAPTMDVFARPGDGWGDSEMRAEQYRGMMNQAGTGRGMTRNQRAAMAAGAQGLIAPGLAQIQQQGNMYGQQLDAYGKQQTANQALQQQDRAYGIEQRKADLNEQKAQQQYRLDQMNAEGNQAYRKASTQEAQLRARGLAEQQNLMQKYQEMYKKNPNDTEALDYIRSLILMSQRRNEPAEPAQSELEKLQQGFKQQKAAQQ